MLTTTIPPARRETHPLIHFMEYSPRVHFGKSHSTSLDRLQASVGTHMERHAATPQVLQHYADSVWMSSFYDWIYQTYKLSATTKLCRDGRKMVIIRGVCVK